MSNDIYAKLFDRIPHKNKFILEPEEIADYILHLENEIAQLTNNWNKLEKLIDEEKTRLAKECSHTYEDSLGKTKYINEDIFNELNNILGKIKEMKEENNER